MVTRRQLLQTGTRTGLGLGFALLAAQSGNGVDSGMGLRSGPHVFAAQAAGTPILQLFYRGTDNQVWTLRQKADRSWSNAVSLGSSLTTDPVAEEVPRTDILHVFYRGPDGAVWTLWRTPDGTWSKHVSLGGFLPNTDYGPAKPIAMQVPGANVLQLFHRGRELRQAGSAALDAHESKGGATVARELRTMRTPRAHNARLDLAACAVCLGNMWAGRKSGCA